MNIAFFIPWITQNRGGTEHVGAMLANLLAERGHAVFIHTDDDKKRSSTYPLNPGIELRCHPQKLTPVVEMQILMELAVQKPDLLVGLHLNRTFYSYVYYAHRIGVPIILSEHINPLMPRRVGSFTCEEREAIFLGADRIHLLLDEFIDTLPDYLHDRIRVLPNTVAPARALSDPGQSEGMKTLLYVGQLVPRKGVDILLRAFAAASRVVSDWQCQLAGTGNQAEQLKALAKSLGIEDRVQFLGSVEEPYRLYATAHLFALPSFDEGQPLVLLEAMAHGLPTVGFADCTGVNALIQHGETGLLAGAEPRESKLAEVLLTLMRDEKKRVAMGTAGYELYLSHYGFDQFAAKWEALVEETAAIAVPASRRLSSPVPGAKTPLERAFERGAAANLLELI